MPAHHIVDLDSLVRFTEAIGKESQYLVQDYQGLLYHYTDLNALKSILQNDDLWLTNSRYSNDEREVLHGYDAAKSVMEKERRRKHQPDPVKWREYLDRIAELVTPLSAAGSYICCFCKRDNLLSQWRAYGQNGTGVCIAFDPSGFYDFCGPDLPQTLGLMRLWSVCYADKVQHRILRDALKVIPAQNPQDSAQAQAEKVADAIGFFIPTFKNSDFEEENELRLIFSPSATCSVEPQYRVARGMLVPYYSLRLLIGAAGRPEVQLAIRSVTVGPSERKAMNVESVKMLLSQIGRGDVEVKASETPYRG